KQKEHRVGPAVYRGSALLSFRFGFFPLFLQNSRRDLSPLLFIQWLPSRYVTHRPNQLPRNSKDSQREQWQPEIQIALEQFHRAQPCVSVNQPQRKPRSHKEAD